MAHRGTTDKRNRAITGGAFAAGIR
jgi:hypothetical protein